MAVSKTEKKPVYIRCPRCELNYCLKKDKYCSVCRAEMEGDKDAFVDDLELELCPICKTNYIQTDEIMCATCLKERQDSNEVDDINAEEWDAYANREDNDDFTTEEEETGEMASISDLDSDVIGDDDLGDDDLGFGLDLDDSDLDDDDDEKDDDHNHNHTHTHAIVEILN